MGSFQIKSQKIIYKCIFKYIKYIDCSDKKEKKNRITQ